MKEDELIEKLESEGFRNVFVHTDPPGAKYPQHTHPTVTAHVVVSGKIEITVGGVSNTFEKGERFDVAAGEIHSAIVGSSGCRYIIGEK